jgi:hypothetical protein
MASAGDASGCRQMRSVDPASDSKVTGAISVLSRGAPTLLMHVETGQ